MEVHQRRVLATPRASKPSIRNPKVIPAMNRNRGAAMPPTNCVRTYPLVSCRSRRVKELNAWHWIMITTASPRVQSRKGYRFTEKRAIPGYDSVRRADLGPQPAPQAAFFRACDSECRTQRLSLLFGKRSQPAQQLNHLSQPA